MVVAQLLTAPWDDKPADCLGGVEGEFPVWQAEASCWSAHQRHEQKRSRGYSGRRSGRVRVLCPSCSGARPARKTTCKENAKSNPSTPYRPVRRTAILGRGQITPDVARSDRRRGAGTVQVLRTAIGQRAQEALHPGVK